MNEVPKTDDSPWPFLFKVMAVIAAILMAINAYIRYNSAPMQMVDFSIPLWVVWALASVCLIAPTLRQLIQKIRKK